jgi:CheY-like chemotaxis protein
MEQQFDIITLDLLLPDMNGWDVLKTIRAGGPNQMTPVLVVTVCAEKEVVIGFNVHDILQKPVEKADLLGALKRARVMPNESRPILVVDNDERDLKAAAANLTAFGYRCVSASNGEDGLRLAAEDPPAAVVLDILMPGMSGSQFLSEFRLNSATRHTPVIVWTVKDLRAHELQQLRSASHSVVLKSEGTQALLKELQALVRPPCCAENRR